MNRLQLIEQIFQKKSFLCVGLDSDLMKIPTFLLKEDEPVFKFNKQIIHATHDFSIAYKINTAFYESLGHIGWETFEKTAIYIKENFPEIFLIADAKRGDIGNTSKMYAKAFFEALPFDAITLSPYMGEDVVKPFLEYYDKWVILLVLTSNASAKDFQLYPSSKPLYKRVIEVSKTWGSTENLMYVVGATKPEMLKEIRELLPDHFLLVPGVGKQGGNLNSVIKYGKTKQGGLIINSSRGIIFADKTKKFDIAARHQAALLQKEMAKYF